MTPPAPKKPTTKRPRVNKNRPEGGWQGEAHTDRQASGQVRYVCWLTADEADAAARKAKAWGLVDADGNVRKSDLVRTALAELSAKPK